MEPQTVTGDAYILSLARFIRSHESALSGGRSAPTTAGPSWLPSLGASKATAAGPSKIIPPKPLSISLHHISYILLCFESLGLPTGRLDEPIPTALRDRRPQSTFSFISASEQRNLASKGNRGGALNPETMSLSSVRSALTRISIGAATTASWFGGSGAATSRPPDPDREVKYLYSAFTKLPAINVIHPEAGGLIEGFEDAATPTTLTPFDVFKNLQLLSFTDVDPRIVTGWEMLSCQLRSLTLIRTGIEDVEELIVGQVLEELKTSSKVESRDETPSGSTSVNGDNQEPLHQVPPLPSLAWHFLSSLCLPSSSLTFFPTLPLSSLRSLDLSHNLLNAIPPSLANSPLLVSLDLSGNLIEDCRGAREALPSIRTLNLRNNRLEALSGLDSLLTLRQIDLRGNGIYEASEVGRLAQLPVLEKIWIKDNPLWEEYLDPRVEVLVEFAKEGWSLEGPGTIAIDGEVTGYWERGRVAERLPLGVRLAAPGTRRKARTASTSGSQSISSGSRGSRASTPRAEENVTPWASGVSHDAVTNIVSVKHKGQHGSASVEKNVTGGETPRKGGRQGRIPKVEGASYTPHSRDGSRDPGRSTSRNNGRLAQEKRRHRRVVELDDDNTEAGGAAVKTCDELSEAEKLKREVLFGTHDRNLIGVKSPLSSKAGETTSSEVQSSSATPTSSRASSALDDPGRDDVDKSVPISDEADKTVHSVSRRKGRAVAKNLAAGGEEDEEVMKDRRKSQAQTAADLRARIEGLKREVGDDWMRVLSRGEG